MGTASQDIKSISPLWFQWGFVMTCNELNIVRHVLKKKTLTITVCAKNTMPMHQDVNKAAPAQTKIATLFSAYLCFSLPRIASASMGKESCMGKHNSYVGMGATTFVWIGAL